MLLLDLQGLSLDTVNRIGFFIADGSQIKALAAINITRPAKADSVSIAPYPMNFPLISSGSCFEVVPPATTEWKPEIAPHAIMTKSIGQSGPPLLLKKKLRPERLAKDVKRLSQGSQERYQERESKC